MAPPASRPVLGSLEITRFIAASAVMLTHFCTTLAGFSQNPGWLIHAATYTFSGFAVQYFFTLSGFVMMTAHHGDFGTLSALPRFWWRRACRIYPCYWLALAIMVPFYAHWLTPGWGFQLVFLTPGARDLVATAWTLHFEAAFYMVFGLCLLPYIGRALLALWVLSVAWLWRPPVVIAHLDPAFLHRPEAIALLHFWHFFASYEFYFFAGLLGGWVFLRFPLPRRLSAALLGLGIFTLLVFMPLMQWGNGYAPADLSPLAGLGFAAFIAGLAGLERAGAFHTGALARRLGAVSYPLYILHLPLLFALGAKLGPRHFGPLALVAVGVLTLAAVYAVCTAATFGFDQPVQRLLRERK